MMEMADKDVASSAKKPSLYVGDLHPDVNETVLLEKFSNIGRVLSIRVCRDALTRRSLGYAYVNFERPEDAKQALETMNFDIVHGRPIRIMWSQRRPSTSRVAAGNVFVKNLNGSVNSKALYNKFSVFGNIVSCKLAVDEQSKSKGYGFVQFETEEAARKAIDGTNGVIFEGKRIYVGRFQSRSERSEQAKRTTNCFTNVFVKNFADILDKEKLQQLFAKFGKIVSCAVSVDGDGKPNGFGFVAFENPDDAEKAVKDMQDYHLPGSDRKLYVSRFQKKCERLAELDRKYQLEKNERAKRYEGANLYLKNLDDAIDDDMLRRSFGEYGNVISAKVMRSDDGRSKGFGFVCFDKPDEAVKAMTAMKGKMVCTKPLYVSMAQRKEDRKAFIASQYMQRIASIRMQATSFGSGMTYMSDSTVVQPLFACYGRGTLQRNMSNDVAVATMVPGQHSWLQMGDIDKSQTQRMAVGAMVYGQQNVRSQYAIMQSDGDCRGQTENPAPYSQTFSEFRGYMAPRVGQVEPLTPHILSQLTVQKQKQVIAERICPLVPRIYKGPDANKIMGMLLEMDNAELLMMLNNEGLLRSRINEAAAVLAAAKV
uniref:Polyadenylate-binding protein n=1 Tax=Ascaris suum TaxID=6253 RepID=F1KSA4_ASCSU